MSGIDMGITTSIVAIVVTEATSNLWFGICSALFAGWFIGRTVRRL
jgi:hypothetical protein